MGLAWSDLDALSCGEEELDGIDLHGELALKNVEELTGFAVVMAGLAGAGWHALLDDVQLGRAEQIPPSQSVL